MKPMYKYLLLALAAFLLYKLVTTDKFQKEFSPEVNNGIAIGFGVFIVLLAIGGMLTGRIREV